MIAKINARAAAKDAAWQRAARPCETGDMDLITLSSERLDCSINPIGRRASPAGGQGRPRLAVGRRPGLLERARADPVPDRRGAGGRGVSLGRADLSARQAWLCAAADVHAGRARRGQRDVAARAPTMRRARSIRSRSSSTCTLRLAAALTRHRDGAQSRRGADAVQLRLPSGVALAARRARRGCCSTKRRAARCGGSTARG